jgi:hypothetical protein
MPKKLPSPTKQLSMPPELVERRIYVIRSQKVMLDADLAGLYLVETRTLIQAVKRNSDRFPDDFMFQLSAAEAAAMRSQTVIASRSRRNTRYLPYAFTELGVAMLSSVLSSERAVQMNIVIMRAFVKLREVLASHRSLAAKIGKLDAVQKDHASILTIVIKDIENLAKGVAKEFEKLKQPPPSRRARIGFYPSQK